MTSLEELTRRIEQKYEDIREYILKTPLYPSPIGSDLLIKAENVQYTGSFKLRGAACKLTELIAEGYDTVITASTGNHGLAVATLAERLGLSVKLFVPQSIASNKEKKLTQFPIELVKIAGDSEKSEITARAYAEEHDLPFISPYNDEDIIAGQGSTAVELEEQVDLGDVGRVYITVGGGGLISGIGAYLKSTYPHIEIVGCQPENSAVMYYSIQAGEVIEIEHKPTISDGSAGGMEKGSITYDIAEQVIDRFVLVKEPEIEHAVELAFRKHGSIIEGSAGVALASYLKDRQEGLVSADQKSIVIWCGGNISPDHWLEIISPSS